MENIMGIKKIREWFNTGISKLTSPEDEHVIHMKTELDLWDGNKSVGPSDNDIVMLKIKSDGLPIFITNVETGRMFSTKDIIIQINGGDEIVSLISQMTDVIETIQSSPVVQCKIQED